MRVGARAFGLGCLAAGGLLLLGSGLGRAGVVAKTVNTNSVLWTQGPEWLENSTTKWMDCATIPVSLPVGQRFLQVHFSTMTGVTGVSDLTRPNQVAFRIVVDGVALDKGTKVNIWQPEIDHTAFSYHWFTGPLAAGTHNLRIQFKPTGAGDTAAVFGAAAIVEY